MKRLVFILILFINFTGYAANDPENDTVRNILFITGHPDDWEIGMAGTAFLLKDSSRFSHCPMSDSGTGSAVL